MTANAGIHLVERPRGAAALLHPLRRRLLESLREPDSASGLSRRLGLPRQKINYHLRTLESAKLVELVEERRKGNCTERIVRARARSYLISPAALGGLTADPDQIEDRFSASYLLAVAGRAIADLTELQPRAVAAGKKLPTLTIQTEIRFATPAARKEFSEELAAAIARLVARHHDEKAPGGRRFRFFVGAYPAAAPRSGRQKRSSRSRAKEDRP